MRACGGVRRSRGAYRPVEICNGSAAGAVGFAISEWYIIEMVKKIIEPYREVAAAIIVGTCGLLLFQQRDELPGLLYAGMLGLFGGHREGEETALQCVQRELHEETGLVFAPERFEPLVSFRSAYPAGGGVNGEFYVLRGVPLDKVVITEGQPLVTDRSELPALLNRMTPSTCYVARLFMELED